VNLGPLVRRSSLYLAVAMLSAGCSSINIFGTVLRHRAIEGRDIDPESAKEIVPGKTTKREVIDRFGQPDRTATNPDGTEEYTYRYVGVIETVNEKLVWAKGTMKDERKRLRVVFSGDVVREFAYTNAAVPEENVARQAGSSEVYLKTTEGKVAFTNELNQVQLDVARGLAAKVALTPSGALDIGIPADNPHTLRMRVRSRFASANPGTDFATTVAGEDTAVAVKQGTVVVRSRTGCETVDAGSQKVVHAPASEAVATIKEIQFPAIHYGFKSTKPLVEDAPLLDCVADLLGDYPDARVRIEGHSDNVGSTGYNLRLSKRRAEGIRRALVANGIAASRLEATGYGRGRPVAANDTEEGRARNRRVEFAVVGAP
jgi:outer membrane protein OmpA-like peptidoglycan-associated protein